MKNFLSVSQIAVKFNYSNLEVYELLEHHSSYIGSKIFIHGNTYYVDPHFVDVKLTNYVNKTIANAK